MWYECKTSFKHSAPIIKNYGAGAYFQVLYIQKMTDYIFATHFLPGKGFLDVIRIRGQHVFDGLRLHSHHPTAGD